MASRVRATALPDRACPCAPSAPSRGTRARFSAVRRSRSRGGSVGRSAYQPCPDRTGFGSVQWAEAARLQRAASPRLREFMEGFQTWLQQQEAGAFGRAMTDLRTIMERWQADEDNGTNTMRPRSQLMRDVTARCQP